MKKKSLIIVLGLLALSLNSLSQIKVNSSGQVGINNTSPSYKLDVVGDFRVDSGSDDIIFKYGQFYTTDYVTLGSYSYRWEELYAVYPTFSYSPDIDSDVNLKTDINTIPDVLGQIKLLRPVTYKLKDQKVKEGTHPDKENKKSYGFIAQEMMEVFPDIVTTRQNGTHGIRYTELIPLLIKAMQEQQAEIDDLKLRIEKLESVRK